MRIHPVAPLVLLAAAAAASSAAPIGDGEKNVLRTLRASASHQTSSGRARRRLQKATTTVVSYPAASPVSTPLPNPERGFYWQHSYRASKPSRLSASSLTAKRVNTGMTLMLRLYYFDTFISGDITQDVLNDIAADFATMREAGMKCVLRFGYIDDNAAPYVSEPAKGQLLAHIAQLAPVLAAGQDVIGVVQAGFVGPWGEWHSSTHFANDVDGRKEVLAAVLDAVPEELTVQIRYPKAKKELYTEYEYSAPASGSFVNDGGFENAASNWGAYRSGYEVSTAEARSGTTSVKVANGGADQWVGLSDPVPAGHMLRVAGYSKSVNADANVGSRYSIYADVALKDDVTGQSSYLWGQTAEFSQGGTSTEWEYAEHEFVIPEGKNCVGVTLYTMYKDQPEGSYAYFDDVAVQDMGVPIQTNGAVLNPATAHSGTHLARTGHHNDCFLASDTDYGTYIDGSQSEYSYLSAETKYTSMGGETCAPDPPRSSCSTAQSEMALFHYSYLNSGYHETVLASWETEGCMDSIEAKLGYRLVLTGGTFPDTAAPDGIAPFEVEFDNLGYAAPMNDRRVQLVLKHSTSGALCAATFEDVDARAWYGGESHTLAGEATLPPNMPQGTYELYLHLTDPSAVLRTELAYKIKVANGGSLNDPATGLIDLGHTVDVAAGNPSSSSAGGAGESQLSVTCGVEADILPGSATVPSAPVTPAPTQAPVTPAPTQAPVTPAPTQAPVTPAPTQAPVTPAPTQAPVTPAPTSSPVTPAPTLAPVPAPTIATPSPVTVTAPTPSAPSSLVQDGGFESGSLSSSWSSYDSGYIAVSDRVHAGTTAVKVTNGGAKQRVELNAPVGSTITISGYSQSSGVSAGLWNDYSIYTDVKYANGEGYLWGQCARFAGGSETEGPGWTYGEWSFVATKDVERLTLYTMYRRDDAGGTAWFDDVSVTVTPP